MGKRRVINGLVNLAEEDGGGKTKHPCIGALRKRDPFTKNVGKIKKRSFDEQKPEKRERNDTKKKKIKKEGEVVEGTEKNGVNKRKEEAFQKRNN